MTPVALPVPTALRKALPWSGPEVAMIILGLNFSARNAPMKVASEGTSTVPSTTTSGFLAATCAAVDLIAAVICAGVSLPLLLTGLLASL